MRIYNPVISGSITFASNASMLLPSGTTGFLPSLSSSYAITASYAENAGGGAGFPFTGSAEVSGSLDVDGNSFSDIFSGILMNPSIISRNVVIPDTHNARLFGPTINVGGSIDVGTNSVLTITA